MRVFGAWGGYLSRYFCKKNKKANILHGSVFFVVVFGTIFMIGCEIKILYRLVFTILLVTKL